MSKTVKSFNFPSFSELADYHIKKFGNSSGSSPNWRRISSGINLEGKCKNKDCEAYDENVWSRLGFGEFHLPYQVKNTPCKMCEHNLKS